MKSSISFLKHAGETGKIIAGKDYTGSSIGDASQWLAGLTVSLAAILYARAPMMLFWGKEFICFYNDACMPLIADAGKHPHLLGSPGLQKWPEAESSLSGAWAEWMNNSEIPAQASLVLSNHAPAVNHVNFSLSPLFNENAELAGILASFTGTSFNKTLSVKTEAANKSFRDTIMQAPMGILLLSVPQLIVQECNNIYLAIIGRTMEESIGKPLFDTVPEAAEAVKPIFSEIINTRKPFYGNEFEVPIFRNERVEQCFFNFVFQPVTNETGEVISIMVVAVEVTETALSKLTLKKEEERLRLSTESTQTATWDLDLKTGGITHSRYLTQIFGYPSDTHLTHEQLRSHLLPEDRETIVDTAFAQAMQTGSYTYEARIKTLDGTVKWVNTNGKVFFDAAEKPVRMLGIMQDVTGKKNQQELIDSSIDKLNIALDATKLGTFELDVATRQFNYSARIPEIFGYGTQDYIDAELIIGHIQPTFLPVREAAHKKARETGFLNYEAKINHVDGGVRWIEVYGKLVFDQSGNTIKILGTIRDVSEAKSVQELLLESEKRYRFLADFMPQFIWTGDTSGRLNYFNRAVYEYTGFTEQELLTDNGWINIVHPDDREENIRRWQEAVTNITPFLFEHRFKNRAGKYRWQLSRAIPKLDEHGQLRMWVGTSTDIDEIKLLEEQKNDFIKMANHELKTPVTTIKGYAQLLMKTHGSGGDPVLSASLATINNQVNKLTNLITDLLDISRIELGSLPLNKEVFNISHLVAESIRDIEAANHTHKIILFNHCPEELVVHGDKDRLSQVLINLLMNAIKYSPAANEVRVTIDRQEDDVVIGVKDFGIGIEEKEQKMIFQRFYRVSGKDEKTFPGFGIGLYIVAEIVNRHEGKIKVNSEKGNGSEFFVLIPLHKE